MKYKKLGKSGIEVSEIGFGAWTIALNWWGKEIDEDEAKRMLKKAYDCGINFFETGDMYGKGKSERLIGEAFKDMRNEVIISTKYGYKGFGELWPIRLLGFATGMISFPFITYFMLGEGITLKTAVSILLAIIIMLLQLI